MFLIYFPYQLITTFCHFPWFRKLSPNPYYRGSIQIGSKRSWDDEDFRIGLLEDRKNAALDPNPQPFIGLEGQAAACVSHSVF